MTILAMVCQCIIKMYKDARVSFTCYSLCKYFFAYRLRFLKLNSESLGIFQTPQNPRIGNSELPDNKKSKLSK